MSSNDRLFAILKGIKIIPMSERDNIVENIGTVILEDDINERLFEVFFGIYTNRQYIPRDDQLNKLMHHYSKYYGTKYLNFYY